ncbi:Ribosomal RNA processing protein 36 [Blattella germanica]|nr:Ribosomal RNA processing protein 36 [Blattella germanica]
MENSDEEVSERTSVREELSKMSFQELQKLKEELGSKVYNEAMFGIRKEKKTSFKRENKNRPREMSSKRPMPTDHLIIKTKKTIPRDPRFDSLCGTYDEKVFRRSYAFLDRIRSKEKFKLKKELKTETDTGRKEEIKYLIQRMENQEREKKKLQMKNKRKQEEHNANIDMLRQGKKPVYIKKSEKKVLELVDQFEELKKTGKLNKHIEKQRKKNARKDKRKLEQSETVD